MEKRYSVALGLADHLDRFANKMEERCKDPVFTYMEFSDLLDQKINSDKDFVKKIHGILERAKKIYFNMHGFNFNRYRDFIQMYRCEDRFAAEKGNITNYEMMLIMQNFALLEKTQFFGRKKMRRRRRKWYL